LQQGTSDPVPKGFLFAAVQGVGLGGVGGADGVGDGVGSGVGEGVATHL